MPTSGGNEGRIIVNLKDSRLTKERLVDDLVLAVYVVKLSKPQLHSDNPCISTVYLRLPVLQKCSAHVHSYYRYTSFHIFLKPHLGFITKII